MKQCKKMLCLTILLGFSSAAFAGDPYLVKFKDGTWDGKVTESVSEGLKGLKVTGVSKRTDTGVTFTVKFDGAKGEEKEVWVITGNKLVQTEYDEAGKAVKTYAADLRTADATNYKERTFDIHCTDKAAGKCDGDIGPQNNWVLSFATGNFDYIVKGLKVKEDPTSLGLRHRFTFTHTGK
ncbi:MAG: hypothetical protein Q7S68_02655 [Deltaproteobacteria bacterium]|nr:hypothetical protein [Deltaproteobacteria bacterium]